MGVAVGLALLLVFSGSGLRPATKEATAALAAEASATPAAEADASTGTLVLRRCGSCHSLDTLRQHPQDANGWTHTVDTMRQMGAQLSPSERTAVIAYLARHFGR